MAEVFFHKSEKINMTSNSSFSFNIDPYDLYSCFYDSVVGLELARRGLHHAVYGRFGYVPNLPAVLEQRELIASELDSKGRVLRELRSWDNGVVELKFERTPATRRRIEAWGYFNSKEEALHWSADLTKHIPPETTT